MCSGGCFLSLAETLNQPYCGSTAGYETSTWFGEVSPQVRSQALIALKSGGGTIGFLVMLEMN
jgi:uncharacterized protein YigA (DUF484 family)